MNVTKFAAFAAALLIGTAVFAAPSAQASQIVAADQTTSGTVIAQDQMETSTKQLELTGLDPTVVYSFSVTPHNALGNGQPSIARMSRSLADITGISTPVAESNDDARNPNTNPNTNPNNANNANTEPTPRQLRNPHHAPARNLPPSRTPKQFGSVPTVGPR